MQMDTRIRQDVELFECPHMGTQVRIRSKVVYPLGLLSFSPPRVTGRTCDHYADCRLFDKTACPMAVSKI